MSANRSKVIAVLATAIMLTTVVPLAFVSAAEDNSAGMPDDLVVVVHPRHAALVDGAVVQQSVGNVLLYDFKLFHADGSPYLVTRYMVDVHTVDARATQNPASAQSLQKTLIYSRQFDLGSEPASAGVVRLPANLMAARADNSHELSLGGLTLTILPMLGAQRESLLDENFHYPAGQYSIPANEAAAAGRWTEADRLDEGFTPVFFIHNQLQGLVDYGNPVLNPGFEFVVCDEQTAEAASGGQFDCSDGKAPNGVDGTENTVPGQHPADDGDEATPGDDVGFDDQTVSTPPQKVDADGKMVVPPWFLRLDREGADGRKIPASLHHINGSSEEGGAALAIHYSPEDNGRSLLLGQIISEPFAPGAWHGTAASKVEVSIKIRDDTPADTPAVIGVGVHYDPSADPAAPGRAIASGAPVTIPADNTWRRVTYDLGGALAGKQILGIYFTIADAANPIVITLDNVVITEPQLAGAVEEKHDATDGFAAFIEARNARVVTDTSEVRMPLVRLANGQQAYLFTLSAMDYTGVSPKAVDVTTKTVVFELLNQGFLTSQGTHTGNPYRAVTGGADGNRFFPTIGLDGQPTGEYTFLLNRSVWANSHFVPWIWLDVKPGEGDKYDGVYGKGLQPTQGFYSLLRNGLKGSAFADSLDYAAQPITFLPDVAAEISFPTTVTISCPVQSPTVRCADVENPDIQVDVATTSPHAETLVVELVGVGTGQVLGTATVATPSGSATIHLVKSQVDALKASGNTTVFARAKAGFFAAPGVSQGLNLTNLAPIASMRHSPFTGLSKGSFVTFASTSSDPDGNPLSHLWQVELLDDPTDDGDDQPAGVIPGGASTKSAFGVALPDDGHYRVTLTISDSGGAIRSVSEEFNASNRAPVAGLSVPAYVRPGEVSVGVQAADPKDGYVETIRIDNGTGEMVEHANTTTSFVVTLADGEERTFRLNVTDDDGDSVETSRTVRVDGVRPVTSLEVVTAGPDSGWHSGPVTINVSRSDAGGSGIAATYVTLDGTTTAYPGTDNLTITVQGDGVHSLAVYTADAAGNVDEVVLTRTIKIDASAPTASIAGPVLVSPVQRPAVLPPQVPVGDQIFVPIAPPARSGTTMTFTALAADPHSGIQRVEFYVDGGAAAGVDTDGTDGWKFVWTAAAGDAPVRTITVAAFNGAGMVTAGADELYVIVVPAAG